MNEEESPSAYKFEVGQIVHHKRYRYRGVVFERDRECEAEEAWYQNNQTQPDKNQPWYHVLVDGSTHTTYVAESNLEPDETEGPVLHPLLKQFFKSYLKGRYYSENFN